MYRGIFTAPPNSDEGIQMVYVPDRQVIRMDGWFGGRQGAIQAVEIPLAEFLTSLGITAADCQQAMQGGTTGDYAMRVPAQPAQAQPTRRAAMETAPPTARTVASRPVPPDTK